MICAKCAHAANVNRIRYNLAQKPDKGWATSMVPHPKNCGCACMHKLPEAWEKMFSVSEPKD